MPDPYVPSLRLPWHSWIAGSIPHSTRGIARRAFLRLAHLVSCLPHLILICIVSYFGDLNPAPIGLRFSISHQVEKISLSLLKSGIT